MVKKNNEGLIFPILDKWAKDNNVDIRVETIDNFDESKIEDDSIYLGLTYNSKLNDFFILKVSFLGALQFYFLKALIKNIKMLIQHVCLILI